MIVVETKPSGLKIRYSSDPRGYWLKEPNGSLPGSSFEDIFNHPQAGDDFCRVPSVTTILGCLDKPALPWWGMRIGIQGVLALLESGDIQLNSPIEVHLDDDPKRKIPEPTDPAERVERRLTQTKRTVNHVKRSAGDRGSSAHRAFETYCVLGILPDWRAYPEEEMGYIVGLRKFLADATMVGGESEVMVGSWEHLYAGRYDRWTHLSGRLVSHLKRDKDTLEVKERVYDDWNGERTLLDLKTGKWVYETHPLQLEAYEGASVENGYPTTDARAVVHLTWDGEYEVRRSEATFQDWLNVRATYDTMQRLSRG